MRAHPSSDRPLRVLLCEDQPLMRLALRMLFTAAEGLEVVGEVDAGGALATMVEQAEPDAVVLDLDGDAGGVLGSLELLKRLRSDAVTVVLSDTDDPETIDACFRRGATAFVRKSIDPRDLPAVVRQAVAGAVLQPGFLLGDAPAHAIRAAGLSAKEAEVLLELAKGGSNRDIAGALWLSEQTVKFHLRNVYRKLGVANRTEALRVALDHHLVEAA